MAEVVQRPIDLSEALTELDSITANIRRKNNTLIDYHIYPQPIPSQIAAFEPRFAALADRRAEIALLAVPKVSLLLDAAPAKMAMSLIPIIEQMASAIDLFQSLFMNYYDKDLNERMPYLPLFQRLHLLKSDIERYRDFQMSNPNRRSAVQLLGTPSQTEPSYCPAAVMFINNSDRGLIKQCMPNELTKETRAYLKAENGLYLWWECPMCAFRLRFHIKNSANMNINSTTEIRKEEGARDLAYRSSWLAKCHTYHPGREEQALERERRRAGQRNLTIPINTSGVGGVKYGCPFCFSHGKDLSPGETAFATAKEFAVHMSASHTRELPTSFMLQALKVGIGNLLPAGVARWDLHIGPL